MPLLMDVNRTPAHWAPRKKGVVKRSARGSSARTERLQIALVNNMGDGALEDTEAQFFDLLDAASGSAPIEVKLFTLPRIPRSDRAKAHLTKFCSPWSEIWDRQLDGLIITGTEPRQPELRKEPYWSALTDLLEWAEENTSSTILSCLAAHASVLHSDGIARYMLQDKRFGVFEELVTSDHVLTTGIPEPMRCPHSRWNQVSEDALRANGYQVLTKSEPAGVNLFVKNKGNSLFVHFQGHPEYGAATLAKEYRRDVKRFLRGERETYPQAPQGCLAGQALAAVEEFRAKALANPSEEFMAEFPEGAMGNEAESAWHASAVRIYRNWLQYLPSRRVNSAAHAAAAASQHSATQ